MADSSLFKQAANMIQQAKHITILTGAGVSKESGVPTFRDAQEGLWAKYNPEELATPMAFQANPKLVWDWYEFRRGMVGEAKPNPGHFALAELEKRFDRVITITQNVDDLHEQAGSQQVIHLHGNIAESKCFDDCQGSPTLIDVSQIEYDKDAGPPACPHCGAWVRPNVVWYHEMLSQETIGAAMKASSETDVMIVVGTSGLVSPASQLPYMARQAGAKIIEVNPDYSMITRYAHLKLEGPSGEMLPQVIAALDAE